MKKSYRGVWGLLAVAFVVFFAYSAYDDDLTIGGYALKHSSMFQSLAEGGPHITDAPVKVTAAELSGSQPESPVTVDTLPKTILFIGDSMLEGLSPRLAAYCESSGHKLYSVIWYSSTSERWGTSDRLQSYIRQIKPDYIFICLGANELFVSNIIQKRTGYVQKMIADIGDIPYLWIGPPNWKEDTGINRIIADNAAAGSFFLSDGMHFERKRDGAHPTSASAAQWMDSIVRWMPAHSSHPIRLETPTRQTARPARVFVHQPNE